MPEEDVWLTLERIALNQNEFGEQLGLPFAKKVSYSEATREKAAADYLALKMKRESLKVEADTARLQMLKIQGELTMEGRRLAIAEDEARTKKVALLLGFVQTMAGQGTPIQDIQQLLLGAQNVLETPLLDGPVEERLKVLALTDKGGE